MADIQFDISLKNNGSNTEGLTLFSPIDASSQKANKYAFVTPFTSAYPANTVFTIVDEAGTNDLTLTTQLSMADVIVLLNGLNTGTFILAFNDAINGNVFHFLSSRNPISFSIDNNTYFGTFLLVDTGSFWAYSFITFPDASTVVIGEAGANIQQSIDNGNTFSLATFPPSAGFNVFQISFVDALNGFVCGANGGSTGRIWKTVDGGATWTLVSSIANSAYWGLWMFDTLNGLCYRDVLGTYEIAITANGGVSWTQVQAIGVAAGFIQFVDSLNAFIFEGFTELLSTNDGGATWTALVAPFTIFSGFALDANNLWIGGAAGAVRYSNDGGNSFSVKDIPTAFNVQSIQAFTTDHIIAGLTGRRYAVTADGGASWTITTIAAGGATFVAKFRDQYSGSAVDGTTNIYKYS